MASQHRMDVRQVTDGLGATMDGQDRHVRETASGVSDAVQLIAPLGAALADADESERYRLLASLLTDLAERSRSGSPKRDGATAEQLEAMARKLQALDQEKATLDDAVKTTRADLAQREKRLEAEQARARELQEIIDDQRTRLEATQKDIGVLEAELTAKSAELHKAVVKVDELTLRSQRAELAAGDRSRVDTLDQEKSELNRQIEELRAQNETLRCEKNTEIEQVRDELLKAKASSADGGEAMLGAIWQRLEAAKPPLADGKAPPTRQTAERLVDAFIELVRFVDDFDQSMRVFLTRYTHHHPTVRVPWEAYAKGDDLRKVAARTVAAQGGRPVGVLKMRLRLLYSWTEAAMIGSDSAIESIASELESFARGPTGMGSDPNVKIKEFIHNDGHHLFSECMKELRSTKLADAFGRGG